MLTPEAAETKHPRSIGWIGTTALAMGGSNQSLFLLAALFVGQGSIPGQGSAAIPLLFVGLLLSWAAAPGWTELVMMWPNRVGGIAGACSEAFRPYNPVLSALTGCCYWWGWVPTCGLTAILSASAIQQWFLPGIRVEILATAIVLFFSAVNLCGIRWVVRLAIPMAAISASLAFISALAPVFTGHVDWLQASTFHLTVPFAGWFGNLTSLMAGLYLIGFAAPAFEAASCHVGETIDPNRNVPRAMLASALMAALYFVILPVVWLGALGPESLGKDLALVLGPTFAPVLGSAAKAAAIGFMMFNMFHGTLQPLAGADDGLLPRSLSLRARSDTPWVATLLTAGMAILFLWIGDPVWLIAAANFTYLIGICMPSVAVWLLRRDAPDMPRPYRAPRGMIVAGLIGAAGWMVSALLGFEQFGIDTVIIALVMAYSGAALYAWRQFSDRRRAGLPGLKRTLHIKLTGAMLAVLILDGAGYYLAITSLPTGNSALIDALQDIFVAVAMLTIAVGLVLPGMIVHSVLDVSNSAKQLVSGTLHDFTLAMKALGRGDLEAAKADVNVSLVVIRSRDEIGEMADSFNVMQQEIEQAAVGLSGARNGLSAARGELLKINQELEDQIRERNRLVEELIVARDAAEAANLAKGNFLASHEIRTPMNGVLTTAELLYHSELTPSQRRHLAIIRSSGDALLSLIDQILDLSKLDAGKLVLQPVDFDLVALVADITAAFVPEMTKKPVELSVRLQDGRRAIWVSGDSLRLRQVLSNLISNAIKFTHQGEIIVELKILSETDRELNFTFVVKDTGIGLNAEFKPRMFEPFSQAHETATRTYGGTGLGLSIIKQIVDLCGGKIEVDSEPGQGSEFRILLALPKAAFREMKTVEPPRLSGASTGMRRKILVAEDNIVNQEVIAESLAKLGHDCVIADDGEAALRAVQSQNYDLVLMDLRMPNMDGFEATQAIRKAEAESGAGTHIPIVALSANAMAGDRERCLDCGMDDHLAKPFTLDGLSAKLESWLPQARGANSGVAGDLKTDATESTTTPAGGNSLIDETALKRISALQRPGRPNVLGKIIGTFLRTAPFAIEQLHAALSNGEFAAARDLAHGLKSSCANLGAIGMAERFRILEALAGEQNQRAAREALTDISDSFPAVAAQLERYLVGSNAAEVNFG